MGSFVVNIKELNVYIIKEQKKLLSFNEVCKLYSIEDEADGLNDIWTRWHNNNSEKAIEKLIKSEKYKKVCKLLFYLKEILKVTSRGEKVIDIDAFENYNKDIVVYRGGSGVFDKNYTMTRNWMSVTASKDRLNTFSVYSGTHASSAYSLDKNKHYWQIEIKVRLDDIFAYYNVGDHEAIISTDFLKTAKVIKQT
jgi:hypothetical protein